MYALHVCSAIQSSESAATGLYRHLPRLHQPNFFPSETGVGYKIPPVLHLMEPIRNEMTIISGLDHRGRNGHEGWKAWMTGTATRGVSIDQLVAASIGDQTVVNHPRTRGSAIPAT